MCSSTKRMLFITLFVTACSGHTCQDPPTGSEPPTGMVDKDIEGCANIGPQVEEFTGGSEYQCDGVGKPIMFTKVSCTESIFCPDPLEKNRQMARFTFGEEYYENLSIGACCADSVEDDILDESCEYSCGSVICDQTLPYLNWIRSSTDEMKKLCCDAKDDGSYDCRTGNILLDVCKSMLDKYIDRVQETDGWPPATGTEPAGNLSWNAYCKSLTATGIENPDVRNYDYDAQCEGIYLGDLDFDQSIARIHVRNTCIYPRCNISSPPTNELPNIPKSCTATNWSEMPNGWPESAWEPAIDADVASGEANAILSGVLGSLLGNEGFSKNITRGLSDGNVLYGTQNCDNTGNCELKINEIYAHINDFTIKGDATPIGRKKLKIRDTYMYLNRIAYGTISPPDNAGIRYFEINEGDIEVTFRGGAKGYLDFFIGGSKTYFNESNRTMVAWNTTTTYGYIDSSDRITFNNIEFTDGDLSISVNLTSTTPNHAPIASATVIPSICGRETTLDASPSYDTDGDHLTYEWYYNDTKYIGSTVSKNFPEGQHTVFLTVRDSKGLVGRKPVTFDARDDKKPPEIPQLNLINIGTCAPQKEIELPIPQATDNCSETITITGEIIQKNGTILTTPIEIIKGKATLETGEYIIEWSATDEVGNTNTAQQTINIRSGIRTTNSLRINDRSKIVRKNASYASITNSGNNNVHLGVEATLGTITSKGNVSLSDKSKVHGSISTSGVVNYQNKDTITVTEPIKENQNLTFGSLFGDSLEGVVFPDRSEQALTFNPRTTPYILLPGSYPETYLNSGSTVILTAGTYYFKSLYVNDASQFLIDNTNGKTQIFVEDDLNLYEPILYQSGDIATIFIGYVGTSQVNLEATYSGTLIAPNAKIMMGTASFKNFSGRYTAKDLELGPDVTLTCNVEIGEPFEPEESCWDGIHNQSETDIDCGGECAACPNGSTCDNDSDCLSNNCEGGYCEAVQGNCSESTATDIGIDGNVVTIPTNGCIMVRDAYPPWWGSRNMQLQSMDNGSYPVPFSWSNICALGEGSGTFTNDWQSETFGPTNSECATLIELKGNGISTIQLRYYAN